MRDGGWADGWMGDWMGGLLLFRQTSALRGLSYFLDKNDCDIQAQNQLCFPTAANPEHSPTSWRPPTKSPTPNPLGPFQYLLTETLHGSPWLWLY